MADPGRLDELKRKFEENPRRYFAPLANEYRKGGDVERAIELCRTYLPQQPTHMSGYIVYGQALYDAGRADEAAQVFQQALALDPENIIALRYLGDIARSDGDSAGALRWYGKVLELDPRNEEITGYIAELSGSPEPRRTMGPERPVPPTVRPEPEPDRGALALEDLMAEPDRPLPEIQRPPELAADAVLVEESLAVIEWPRDEIETPPAADLVQPVEPPDAESMMDFGLDEAWSGMSGLETSAPFAPPPSEAHATGEQEAPLAAIAGDDETPPHGAGAEHEETQPYGASAGHEAPVAADEAAATDAGAQAPVESPTAEAAAGGSSDVDLEGMEGEPLAGVVTPTAADESPLVDESEGPSVAAGSPFVTETMAELYVAQGLHADALAIYRQLAGRRGEQRLHDRVAQLEAQVAPASAGSSAPAAVDGASEPSIAAAPAPEQAPGETVREFFARIGERRPQAAVHIGAESEAGLGRLFGGATLDASDENAAESLAGAFTSAGPGDGAHSA